jgi:hypothetical protein
VRIKKWMRAYFGIAVPQVFAVLKVANSVAVKAPSLSESALQLSTGGGGSGPAAAVSEFIDTTSKTSRNLR